MQEQGNIQDIEGLDVEAGLRFTGTWALYTKLLGEFVSVIEKRAALFNTYCDSGDCEAYRVEVHSLKSNARTIGATELGKMAEDMEEKCRQGDLNYARANTPALIAAYERYLPILEPYKKPPVADGELACDSAKLMELFARMLTALEDFDIDRAEELINKLLEYKADEATRAKLMLLREAVASYSYGQAEEITRELMTEV